MNGNRKGGKKLMKERLRKKKAWAESSTKSKKNLSR
jgi:hypothetical protein